MENNLITQSSLARRLGICAQTVAAWRKQGKIPRGNTLSNRRVVWDKDTIERFLIENGLMQAGGGPAYR